MTTLLAASKSGGGSFLVSPSLGLMIWTLLAFGITLWLLNKLAFPRIAEALDRRRKAIEESIEAAQRAKREADDLLDEDPAGRPTTSPTSRRRRHPSSARSSLPRRAGTSSTRSAARLTSSGRRSPTSP